MVGQAVPAFMVCDCLSHEGREDLPNKPPDPHDKLSAQTIFAVVLPAVPSFRASSFAPIAVSLNSRGKTQSMALF